MPRAFASRCVAWRADRPVKVVVTFSTGRNTYGRGRCRCDRVSDVDKARDALIQCLWSLPGTTVAWRSDHP